MIVEYPTKTQRPIPVKTGIGLRSAHYREILATLPEIGWMEVHSENFFSFGGAPIHYLEQIRSHYPISLHGVGLSLGSTDPLSRTHLFKLKSLIERINPFLISEHLSWSSVGGRYLNDLLPIPYTEQTLGFMCNQIERTQDFLGRQILMENISSYMKYEISTIPEWEFIGEIASRTGCGILLDVNNIYVSSENNEFDPHRYLQAIPAGSVLEIHLAGFDFNGELLVDTHSRPVHEKVWRLYQQAIEMFGEIKTLVEWDANIPELPVLIAEARKADLILEGSHAETS